MLQSLIDQMQVLQSKLDELAASREQPFDDSDERMAILESKMSLPEPKPLACHHAPPPTDDSHYPTPAEVQAFLKAEGIEQYPATFCMDWWMESNPKIDRHNRHDSGLSRADRYAFGILGGEHYENDQGVTHWRPTEPPAPPPSWDNEDDMVVPAEPSRYRSDAEKDRFVVLFRKLYPKLRKFGMKHLGGSRWLGCWLSEVKLAMLTAYWDRPNDDVTGFSTKSLPPLEKFDYLRAVAVEEWNRYKWGQVIRRLARQWAEQGHLGAGTRRPTVTDARTQQTDEATLEAVPDKDTSPGPAPAGITQFALHYAIRVHELPLNQSTNNLLKVVDAICESPDATRAVQIEKSGLSRSTFLNHLARIRERSGGKISL